MKRILLIVVSFTMMLNAYGQQNDISTVSPTSAPAFTVLGISPTEIAKPNNWNKFQASLYQNLTGNDGAAPRNFAMEFKPYWLSNHPKFTYTDYLEKQGFSLRNLSLSIASAKAPYIKDSVQSLGFGFRLPIAFANKKRQALSQNLQKEANSLKAKVNWQSDFVLYLLTFTGQTAGDLKSDIESKIKSPPAGDKLWKERGQIQTMLNDTLSKTLSSMAYNNLDSTNKAIILSTVSDYITKYNQTPAAAMSEKIKEALKETGNFQFSGALALAFPTNQFDYSRFSQAALWVDYTTKFGKSSPVDGTAALRYVRVFETDSVNASSNVDLIYKINFSFGTDQKLAISAWGVLRKKSNDLPKVVIDNVTYTAAKNSWDNKYGIDISYKFSNTIALSYSFGKDYKNLYGSKNGGNQLISFLNLFYSLNTKLIGSDLR
ncbi:hypothetical protein [Pedobacter frigidisoli]|uniref:hypothetical protein n=1 Tax=Pedobacter frigidisoli TaxID=2530455 RepID=UPI00292E68CA|nr:hypothetical protein [Pedobacter frigidisoli]